MVLLVKKVYNFIKGGGRKILDKLMEEDLAKWWIDEINSKGIEVPLSVIK